VTGTSGINGIRTDIPHPARVYDYMLGGKDNLAADRETAERSLELVPEMLDSSRGNRDFLVRAIRFLRCGDPPVPRYWASR
jgi:hypothetical protein